MIVTSPEPSLVTYAIRAGEVPAAAGALSVAVWVAGGRSAPPQASRVSRSNELPHRASGCIEGCLVTIAGLVQALDLGNADRAGKDGTVDVRLGQLGAGQVGPGEVGLQQVGVLEVGALQVGAGEIGVRKVGLVEVGAAQVSPLEVRADEGGAHDPHGLIPGVRSCVAVLEAGPGELGAPQVADDPRAGEV